MLYLQTASRSWIALLLVRLIDWTPRWLRWLIALIALALPFAVFKYGHAMKQALADWESRQDVQTAAGLMENESTRREAVQLLLAAWLRSPEEPSVIRSLARASSEIGLPHYTRHFYELLRRFEPLTDKDQLDLASALTRLSDHKGAGIILDALRHRSGESADLWRAQVTLARARGDEESARQAMQRVVKIAPDDHVAVLNQAASLASSKEDMQRAQGITALLDEFEKTIPLRDPQPRNHCFWALAGISIDEPAQRARFAALIARMPWGDIERSVVRHVLELPDPLQEKDRVALRAWVRDLLKKSTSITIDDRLAVARVLQRINEHLLVLEVIPFELALEQAELCAARIDSLMAERLWAPAEQIMAHPRVPLSRPLQAVMQAWHALESLGDTAKSTELLGIALHEARSRDSQAVLVTIAHLAMHYRQYRVASEALAAAFDPQFPVATHLMPLLMESARRGGAPATDALRLLAARERAEPWNLELHRQTNCLRLLCGDQVEQILAESVTTLTSPDPDVYSAFLAAFASYRMGQGGGAARYLELLIRPHGWQPHERAAMVAILRAAGENELAGKMAASVPSDVPLFVEERRLLASGR